MSERPPCTCGDCTRAGVGKPSITIPGYRGIPARELHGVALVQHYEAQDRLRATIQQIRDRAAQHEADAPQTNVDDSKGPQHG